jgi:hypothetical protein
MHQFDLAALKVPFLVLLRGLLGSRGERRWPSRYSTRGATVPAGTDCELGLRVREREPAAGRSLTAGQEGRVFLLNSYWIRLIHLPSLYREVNLTPK